MQGHQLREKQPNMAESASHSVIPQCICAVAYTARILVAVVSSKTDEAGFDLNTLNTTGSVVKVDEAIRDAFEALAFCQSVLGGRAEVCLFICLT